jgi:hypothetical protein
MTTNTPLITARKRRRGGGVLVEETWYSGRARRV